MKNNKNLITIVIVAIIVGAVGFFAGMKYQQNKAVFGFPGRGNGQFGQRQGGARFGGANGRPVMGEITAIDENSITVKLMDGSSKIVNISDSTTYSKTDTGAKSDLKIGAKVATFGTANSDGSVTAQNVQLNPMFRMLGTTPTPVQK